MGWLSAFLFLAIAMFFIYFLELTSLESSAESILHDLESSVTKTEEERKAVIEKAIATLEMHFPKHRHSL